jgi:hypothetical protein
MKVLFAAALFANTVVGAASAQTAAFQCPPPGTSFAFKSALFEIQSTATGQDGNVCLFTQTVGDKADALRIHWGLIGSADSEGEAFASGFDLKSFWPLKVGNKVTSTVAVPRDGKTYTSIVTMTVAAFEQVTVPAGTFDAFRIEESREGQAARSATWWAPALSHCVKEIHPHWRDHGETIVIELAFVKHTAK